MINTSRFEKLYEEMEDEGLIPAAGDSEYFWPAMVLRIGRLLHERLNNGNINYDLEDSDGFYHELEKDLDKFGRKFGFGDLGHILVHSSDEEVQEVLDRVVQFFQEKRDVWKVYKWLPTY